MGCADTIQDNAPPEIRSALQPDRPFAACGPTLAALGTARPCQPWPHPSRRRHGAVNDPSTAGYHRQTPVTALSPETAHLISDWPAVQSGRVRWSPDNVTLYPDGSFDLRLTEAPEGSWRPYLSGEVASVATATYGTWTWFAQVPRMVDGAVFGMFTFQADASNPRVEFDIEFVGAATTQLELNVHMAGPDGKNVSLVGGPYKVQLGFDAAEGVHSYAVTVTEGQAIFLIDGTEVVRFGPEDMTNGVWREGEMRSYADLWAATCWTAAADRVTGPASAR